MGAIGRPNSSNGYSSLWHVGTVFGFDTFGLYCTLESEDLFDCSVFYGMTGILNEKTAEARAQIKEIYDSKTAEEKANLVFDA